MDVAANFLGLLVDATNVASSTNMIFEMYSGNGLRLRWLQTVLAFASIAFAAHTLILQEPAVFARSVLIALIVQNVVWLQFVWSSLKTCDANEDYREHAKMVVGGLSAYVLVFSAYAMIAKGRDLAGVYNERQ